MSLPLRRLHGKGEKQNLRNWTGLRRRSSNAGAVAEETRSNFMMKMVVLEIASPEKNRLAMTG